MSRQIEMSERVENYVWQHSRESAIAKRLRAETAKLPQAGMQIGPDQAAFLALLVQSIGAVRCIEIGTFTGYSALAVAAALPSNGKLVCCDVSAEWTAIGRRYWQEAELAARIDLHIAPALETLQKLLDENAAKTFDFAFIDADKTSYDAYYEQCLKLLRHGGLIALDNMLWSGRVADVQERDADTEALRKLNAKIFADERVDATLLAVGDGVMLVRKR